MKLHETSLQGKVLQKDKKYWHYLLTFMQMESLPRCFVINKTFLELHSETVLQRSAEQLTQMGTCFKMFKELTEKKDIKWLHTAQMFFYTLFLKWKSSLELLSSKWAHELDCVLRV